MALAAGTAQPRGLASHRGDAAALLPRARAVAAGLYMYFVERTLNLLRPGGRLAFVLTNK